MTHTYTYKQPNDNWFWLAAASLYVLFTIYILARIFQADKYHWLALWVPITFGVPGVVLLSVCILRRQYHQVDQNKVVTVDTTSRQIVVNQSGRETIVSAADVKDVEIYHSWNSNPLFASLGYVKFNLLNGDNILVTHFTADDIALQPLITGKPVKRKTRFMNPIK